MFYNQQICLKYAFTIVNVRLLFVTFTQTHCIFEQFDSIYETQPRAISLFKTWYVFWNIALISMPGAKYTQSIGVMQRRFWTTAVIIKLNKSKQVFFILDMNLYFNMYFNKGLSFSVAAAIARHDLSYERC